MSNNKYLYYANNNGNNSLYRLLELIRLNFKSRYEAKIDAGLKLSPFNSEESINLTQGSYHYISENIETVIVNKYNRVDESIMGEVVLHIPANTNIEWKDDSNYIIKTANGNTLPISTGSDVYQLRFTTDNQLRDGKYLLYCDVQKFETPKTSKGNIQIYYTGNISALFNNDWFNNYIENNGINNISVYYSNSDDDATFTNVTNLIAVDNYEFINGEEHYIRIFFNSSAIDLGNMMSNVSFDKFEIIQMDGNKIVNIADMFSCESETSSNPTIILTGIVNDPNKGVGYDSGENMFKNRPFSDESKLIDTNRGIDFGHLKIMRSMFDNCIKHVSNNTKLMLSKINSKKCYDFNSMFNKCEFSEDTIFGFNGHSTNNNSVDFTGMFTEATIHSDNLPSLNDLIIPGRNVTATYNNMFSGSNISDCSGLNMNFENYDGCTFDFESMFENCYDLIIPPVIKLNNPKLINFNLMFCHEYYRISDKSKLDLTNFSKWSIGKSMQISCENMFYNFDFRTWAETLEDNAFLIFDENSSINAGDLSNMFNNNYSSSLTPVNIYLSLDSERITNNSNQDQIGPESPDGTYDEIEPRSAQNDNLYEYDVKDIIPDGDTIYVWNAEGNSRTELYDILEKEFEMHPENLRVLTQGIYKNALIKK